MQAILFLYNADSGAISGLVDLMHKTFSPHTYPCRLCAITYGIAGMRRKWKDFTASLPYHVVFLHNNELSNAYPALHVALPSIVWTDGTDFKELISSTDFTDLHTLESLIETLKAALQSLTPTPPSGS